MDLFNEKVVIANDLHVLGTIYGPTGPTGKTTVSQSLPGGGASPDNNVGEDGDIWLVVSC